MQGILNTAGGGSSLKIVSIAEGDSPVESYQAPFLLIQLINFNVRDRVGESKVWEGKIKFKIVTFNFGGSLTTSEAIAKISQVQDRIDSFVRPAGSRGLEDSEWSVTYPMNPGTGNLIICEQSTKFQVNVARGDN
jgi:hypothetical protein